MTTKEINVAIATACGWDGKSDCHKGFPSCAVWVETVGRGFFVPNFHGSLDAMHEAEQTLTDKLEQNAYGEILIQIINDSLRDTFRFLGATSYHIATATAAQRAEAFLRVKGLWK